MKTVQLSCGHEVPWQEWGGPGQEDFPTIGHYAFCQECGQDQDIADLDLNNYNFKPGKLITQEAVGGVTWPNDVPDFLNPETLIDCLQQAADPDQFAIYGRTVFATGEAIAKAIGALLESQD